MNSLFRMCLCGLLVPFVAIAQESTPPAGFDEIDHTLELGTVLGRMEFDIATLQVDPGSRVKLTLKNTDRMQHNWVLCRPGKGNPMVVAKLAWVLGAEAVTRNYVPDSDLVLAATGIVNPDETETLYFKAPQENGAYPYVCTLPGHALTMRGVLYVGIAPPAEAPKPTTVDFPENGIKRAKQLKKSYLRHQDSGRVFSGTLFAPDSPLPPVYKGIAVRIGEHGAGGVVFDTDLLRVGAGWIGNFIETTPREDEAAENRHKLGATPVFITEAAPGWASPADDSLKDPRARPFAPLPDAWGRYNGLYLSKERVVFDYNVGDRRVLESPWLENAGGHMVFTRTFEIAPSETAVRVVLCNAPDAYDFVKREAEGVTIFKAGKYSADGLAVAMASETDAVTMGFGDLSRVELKVPASTATVRIKVFIARLHHQNLSMLGKHVNVAKAEDLTEWTKGGAPAWPGEMITIGELATVAGDQPYVVDTLTMPYDNPWNALMYASGHDFFSNGDAAVCMSHGDVWIVRGIDDSLEKLRWKRFATGLSSPLGLKIVDDLVHVTCHDQITRLHDLNGDGEADYYENFNNDCQVTRSHHRFATNLDTDPDGNFYYTKCTEEGASDHGGSVIRVSKDGSQFEIIATGLRNPNGMAISPGGLLTFGKQQGGWIPSSGIQTVRSGGFYGYMPAHHREQAPTTFEQPLCWIPHGIDNSSGGQAWVPADDERWGPLAGSLLHFSYGKCNMFLVPHEEIDGTYQGAVVPIPGVGFRSSAMRARFRAADGQLYVSGLRGWQTSAQYAGALQRVRYTGKPLAIATGFQVEPDGIRIGFSQPVDPAVASDPQRYKIHQWNYRWTESYGSKDYSVNDPEEQGRDVVEISSVELSKDQRFALLKFNVQPVNQIQIVADLQTENGEPLRAELYGTVNVVPER